MSGPLHIVGGRQSARLRAAADLVPAAIVADCHRRRRGPYTGIDTVVGQLLDDAWRRWPELVERHRVELLYGMPDLTNLIGPAPQTLASTAPFAERTRFFGASMIRCMSHGVVTFLIKYARQVDNAGGDQPVLFFDQVQEAEATTKEFLALLLRRADPSRLQLVFGSDGSVQGELGMMLATLNQVDAPEFDPPAAPDDSEALLKAFFDSDCTSDDPAQLRAYQLASPAQRAASHDRRADELLVHAGWGDKVGALAYHCEHGSDPADRGRRALFEAQQLCVEIGFSAMVVELGHRGRAVTDPVREQETFCRFTMQVAAALVPLGDLEGSLQLYRDLRRRYTLPKIHMATSYAIAMLYTRFFTPRDHDQAVEWQNNAIALAGGLPDARDRLVFGVFQDNAMALIEMHRGNLGQALTLVNEGISRLDTALSDNEWVLHRSQLLYNRARLLAGLGRLDEAYQDFSTLVEIDPYYTDYLSERAKISRRRGDLVAAMADYDRAEALAPPFPELHYNRGTAYDELGELELAVREYRKVLELEADDLPAQLSLADALIRLEDLDAAEEVVGRGLQLRPTDPQLLCMQGSILLAGAQAGRAIEVLDQVLAADPRYPAALVNRAVAAFELGRPEESVRDLTTCIELAGDDPDLRLNRGLALLALSEPNRALADFERALEMPDADLAELHRGRSEALLAIGQPELAAVELQAVGGSAARRRN